MRSHWMYCLLLPVAWFSPALSAQPVPIVVDGRFEDWKTISPLFQPDRPEKAFDLTSLWATDDEDYLFLRIDLNQDILLQENNSLALYLDIDGQGVTGDLAGAEIVFFFGERKGYIQHDGESLPIEYQALDLCTAPSTMGRSFELSIAWDAHPWLKKLGFGQHPLGVMLFDRRAKEILCYAYYSPRREAHSPISTSTLDKADPNHLRLVTHNVNKRHLQPDKRDAFTRIYRALSPDILVLEEAYEGSPEEILDYFRPALPNAADWHAYKAGEEATVVLSPFKAIQVAPLGNSAAYLLDLRPVYDGELALIVLSLPCCRADSARQAEAEQIAGYVQLWKNFQLKPGTPIVLAGDANLVGPVEQLLTLQQAGDWDGAPLEDLCPRQLQRPTAATWRGAGFSPSRLDYVLYSASCLKVGRRFVFDTVDLPAPLLKRYDLRPEDAPDTYKHMPVVADLILPHPK